jgi:1-aminocyclopropane-1-carboxylate deaminase
MKMELITEYHFGGYGKVTQDLVAFINEFYEKNSFRSYLYWKDDFGVMDRIATNYFPAESKILLIHTGGIQGIEGMNTRLRKTITNN